MSEKRRDKKGRLLRSGESQRQDGKYEYRYTDRLGKRRSVYSWKLVDTDKPPPGKRACEPLRDMEKRLAKDEGSRIELSPETTLTLNDMYARVISERRSLKPSSLQTYASLYSNYVMGGIGTMSLGELRYSTIKKLYTDLLETDELKPASVTLLHSVIHSALAEAVKDNIIGQNPSEYVMKDLKKTYSFRKTKRHALTISQQNRLLDFVSASDEYGWMSPLISFLLGTGCRIGEAAGLTWGDCDFRNNVISIRRSLMYVASRPEGALYVSTPKTEAGRRDIPMLPSIRKMLLGERDRQRIEGGCNLSVDGVTGFVFFRAHDRPILEREVYVSMQKLTEDANAQEASDALREGREPLLLPHFSPHTLRHTFCTRMCENTSNIKVVQEIMGHSVVSITMDIYNEATMDKKAEVISGLESAIRVV